jgi:hypothetical protein
MSAHAIMMVILGGMGNFAGAIAGAFAFEYLLHVFKDLPAIGTSTPASTGSCGSACSSCRGDLRAARPAGRGRPPAAPQGGRMSTGAVLLEARGLTKRFGGLAAVNDVSLDLWLGRIHAVIGPNGAGKSTLTNLLSGDLPPDGGHVKLAGTDVTGRSPEAHLARRPGPQLPEDQHLPAVHGLGERAAGRAVAGPASRQLAAPRHVVCATNERAERALELAGLRRAAMPSPAPSATASSASSRSR